MSPPKEKIKKNTHSMAAPDLKVSKVYIYIFNFIKINVFKKI
jgi:hypothetical protein